MDKSVVLAVAGSGKTRKIIESLSLDKRTLIITYTNNNYTNLHQRILDKFGEIPKNISLCTYFSFLYSFCYLPCVYHRVGSRSMNYNQKHETFPRKGVGATSYLYYLDYSNNLLGNRLSLLINNFAHNDIINRIEKFYDLFMIDEVQDFAANDFNFINSLADGNIQIMYVGDYYQHTYDTSRDGNTRENLHKNGQDEYKKLFNPHLKIDDTSLLTSYRCSTTVCEFVASKLDIDIESSHHRESSVEIVQDGVMVKKLVEDIDIPKLFFRSHADYDCVSTNWGASKGIDHFKDVCVVLNSTTWKMMKTGNFTKAAASTKNRLYVAVTRARGNVYFIEEKKIAEYKIEERC